MNVFGLKAHPELFVQPNHIQLFCGFWVVVGKTIVVGYDILRVVTFKRMNYHSRHAEPQVGPIG